MKWESYRPRSDDDRMRPRARPLLADAEFVKRASEGRAPEINTCIACATDLAERGHDVHLFEAAAELDARRAVDQGSRLAARL